MRLRHLARPAAIALSVCAVALTAACDDSGVRISTRSNSDAKGVLKVIDALQCPDQMGALTRKGSAQADGTVCTYTGPRGAEVELHLVRLADEPVETVLGRFERLLSLAMPQTAAQIDKAAADSARADAEAARADAEGARADAQAARADAQAARADAEADRSADASSDAAHISAPGMTIDAEGDRARVSLPGIHVDADGDKANVRIGGFTIQANDGEAKTSTVRVRGDLSDDATGEATSVQIRDNAAEIRTRSPGEATRQTWTLSDNAPSPAGWRRVGYEARGPRGGPIVVATVRAREQHADGVFDDAKDLVALNVGE